MPFGLAVVAFAVALLQRPGEAAADTKIDLHVDPSGFLGDVASVWTNTGSLGEVQGGQYAGYLFPMGPFHALGGALGLSPWLTQRLWLGLVLALAAWGVVRLLDALVPGPRGVAHVVAGLLIVLNPYTVVYADRAAFTLLGLAVLPWLLLAVVRGLRAPRGWWWPAAFALLVASAGAGVNAAVVAWVLVAPVALVAYERLLGGVSWRDVLAFGWRTTLLSALASAWWALPALVQAGYGIDFLQFTEQPGAIWGPTSIPESLRLMGYWPSYLGVGFGTLRPFYDTSPDMLFEPVVLVASFLVPALALAGFLVARRWRYGPFFLGLLLVGLVVMTAGFPPETPLRRGLTFTYNHLDAVQFLRTTHKAGPLVAIALACLGGYAAAAVWRRLPRRAAAAFAVAGVALLALSVWPLTRGRAVDGQVVYDGPPAAWKQAAAGLDRDLPENSRAMVLPGALFGFYDWGGTVDPILPALTDRPVAVRQFVPRADLHSVDLQWTVDALLQQGRVIPGQLRPLLGLLGVGAVVTGADDDVSRNGAVPAADAAASLDELGAAAKEYGPARSEGAIDGAFAPTPELPRVRRTDLAPGRGIVRIQPAGPPTIVDGSAEAIAGLAAFGALPARLPIEYAADRGREHVRQAARSGAELVISDSNRRRVFVAARLRQNTGATLGATDPISEDAALLDPFEDGRNDARTVALLDGARYLRAPLSPGFPQYPEHRPFAALDGDARTEWLADSHLDQRRHWLEIGLDRRRDVGTIELLPAGGRRTAVVAVRVGGRDFPVRPGWNTIEANLRAVDKVRIRVYGSLAREDLSEGNGLAEVRIGGLRVRERLRPPTVAESALRSADLRRTGLTYLFSRATGDRPFRRDAAPRPPRIAPVRDNEDLDAERIRDAQDPEIELSRSFRPPAARDWRLDAWVSISPQASDSALDRLAGMRSPVRLTSSGRFQGLARYRASGAFDGDPLRAWVADRLGGPPPWIGWETRRATAIDRLQVLTAVNLPAGRPTVVRLRSERGVSGRLELGPTEEAVLQKPLVGRRFRLEVLEAEQFRGGRGDTPRTVAIADIVGRGVPSVRVPSRGALRFDCRAATVRAGEAERGLRPAGTVADLEAGRPLRALGCGKPLPLAAAGQRLTTAGRLVRVHHLRLRSPAPDGLPRPRGGGAVLDSGRVSRGRHDGVRVRVDGPAWLVLGESFNKGWRAECDGRDLGEPVVVDGYANGWRPPRDCRAVELRFGPQRAVTVTYWLSGAACLALLAYLLLARGRRRAAAVPSSELAVLDPPRPLGLGRAALAGALAATVFGFVFSLRAGLAIGPGVALLLWRGVPVPWLVAAACGLLGVVVPGIYLVFPPDDRGGYNPGYPLDVLGAHWVGVAAFVLLFLALARSLRTARAPHGDPVPWPTAATERQARP